MKSFIIGPIYILSLHGLFYNLVNTQNDVQ